MKFRVDWDEETLDHLAVLWTEATDRLAIVRAEREIDQRLASDPYLWGVPLMEGLYTTEFSPLRVAFEVSDADRLVTVVSLSLLK